MQAIRFNRRRGDKRPPTLKETFKYVDDPIGYVYYDVARHDYEHEYRQKRREHKDAVEAGETNEPFTMIFPFENLPTEEQARLIGEAQNEAAKILAAAKLGANSYQTMRGQFTHLKDQKIKDGLTYRLQI
tara:strand:+ start:596 stop:985 length:390 start_codon:yes stop_codon:yes gene_type:complete